MENVEPSAESTNTEEAGPAADSETAIKAEGGAEAESTAEADGNAETAEDKPRRSRRGRRGRRRTGEEGAGETETAVAEAAVDDPVAAEAGPETGTDDDGETAEKPKRRRRPRRTRAERDAAANEEPVTDTDAVEMAVSVETAKVAESDSPVSEAVTTGEAATGNGLVAEFVADDGDVNPVNGTGATTHDDALPAASVSDENGVAEIVSNEEAGSDQAEAEGAEIESGELATAGDSEPAAAIEPAAPQPQRRGWWNRVVG